MGSGGSSGWTKAVASKGKQASGGEIGALRTLLKLTSPKDAMGTIAADALSRLWAPQQAEFPLSIGEEAKDPVPVFDQTFWRAGRGK